MYKLDLKNSKINYATQTEKKYFKIALDYALKNNFNHVKINRINFIFDFENMNVLIGMSNFKMTKYKMIKEV